MSGALLTSYMENPIWTSILNSGQEKISLQSSRPPDCNFPIFGIPWQLNEHDKGKLSIQETEFLGNHLQLVELIVSEETALELHVQKPNLFLVVVLEGFFKYYQGENLSFYGIGNSMYMIYTPQSVLHLRMSIGKHALMVISIEMNWILSAHRPYPKLSKLINALQQQGTDIVALPMCWVKKTAETFWRDMQIVRTNLMLHRSTLVANTVKLIDYYHEHLLRGDSIKRQLSVEIANKIFDYIQLNLYKENRLTMENIVTEINISDWKVREYAKLLFGKPLYKYIKDLRMLNTKRLLETTDLPIGEIIHKMGYVNIPYFFTTFQQYFHKSPLAYRKDFRKKQLDNSTKAPFFQG